MQAAINAVAAGKINEAHIPTPETVLSNIRYDELYPPRFSQPATYIRFSSTVEDCCGCPYNMVEEDDVFLKALNEKRDPASRCSEDQFEEVMNFFEEIAQTKQPFAAVDNAPVLSYAEIEESFDALVEDGIKKWARAIYDHWRARRMQKGNRPLQPQLKVRELRRRIKVINCMLTHSLQFETGQETDDADPYVCFRRREVRQTRKTRGRDAQSAEKLRRLRKELEDARQLLALVRQRELARKEMFDIEKQIFLQRAEVKEMKRKLGIRDDDEDLINQKVNIIVIDHTLTKANILHSRRRSPPRPLPINDLRRLWPVFLSGQVHRLRKICSRSKTCKRTRRTKSFGISS